MFDANGYPAFDYFLTAPGQFKSLQVARDHQGNSLVLAVGLTDNQVYGLKIAATGVPIGSWAQMGRGQVKAIEAVPESFASGEYFVLGLDNQVYAHKFTDAGDPDASGYALAAYGRVNTFRVGVSQSSGAVVPEVFAVGLDNQVYYDQVTNIGETVANYHLAAAGYVRPDRAIEFGAAQPASGLVPELFVTGTDSRVYVVKFSSTGLPLGPYALAAAGQVKDFSVGPMSNDTVHPELFAIGLDDQVYGLKTTAAGDPTGGYFLTAPGQVLGITASYVQKQGNEYSELFAIGLDSQVYVQFFDVNGNPLGYYYPAGSGQVK
jgi:hypothetical protein